jgi:hypothetical protein
MILLQLKVVMISIVRRFETIHGYWYISLTVPFIKYIQI